MLESTKEGLTGLPEGSDIGLGPGDRAFEPHYSDQNPSEIANFRGVFLILCLLRRRGVSWLPRIIVLLETYEHLQYNEY